MDFTKLGPIFTTVGTGLSVGGFVVPASAPAWTQGVVIVVGIVVLAFGQYFSHQTTKSLVATQDVHEDAINALTGVDPLKPVGAGQAAQSASPQGSLVNVLTPPSNVPTLPK